MKHVIIGASAAGLSAAKTIRSFRSNDEIIVISTDESIYSRVMLHKYIAGERDEKSLSFVPEDFFTANSIRWLPGVTVTGVDAVKKTVRFEGGSESFDRLLIATGAESIVPPVPNLAGAKNVLTLRSLPDAKAIRAALPGARNIVIVGGGLVGLEAAYALLQRGKKPVVVDVAQTILSVNLDAHAANVYQEKFEEAGCTFLLGRKVSEARRGASGLVESLVLDDGARLPCDMVIVAAGVMPAIAFLKESGIRCGRNVAVDKHLATNVDGVYAAGDVAGLSGIWPNAVKQGETAAKNMCGVPAVYSDTFALKNTVNFFGVPSVSVGVLKPDPGDSVEIREDRNRYERVILRGGVAVGALLQGNIANAGFWQHLIKNRIDISGIPKPVWSLSYADFYGTEENGEYKWVTTA